MTTTTAPTTACPTWCATDHAADEIRERARAAELGRAPELEPFHSSQQTIVGDPDAGEGMWANVSLSIDLGTGRPMVSVLDQDVTVEVAEELARVLPGIIAQARATV